MGWALFLVSMFMPWFGMPGSIGWSGWLSSLIGLISLITGDNPDRYILMLLPITNFIILLTPLFYFRLGRGKCQRCWMICIFACGLMLLIFILSLFFMAHIGESLRIGYYLWCISVPLVTVGLYKETKLARKMLRA